MRSIYRKNLTKHPKANLGIIHGTRDIFMEEDSDNFLTNASCPYFY